MNLTYLLQSLLKRKWIILGSMFLTLVLTTVFLLYKKKLYESAAQYSTGFTIQQVTLVNTEFNPYEADTKFNNVLETFKSPKVIGLLSYNLLLHDLQHPDYAFRTLSQRKKNSDKYKAVDVSRAKVILEAKIDSLALLSTVHPEEKKLLEFLELYEYDYVSLEKTLIIDRIPRTDYLNIVFRSENPTLSAYVVNKIGEEFLRFYNSLGSTLSTESVEKISNIVDQKKQQVDSITENLRRLKASQGTLDPVELSKNAMLAVNQLSSKLADEKAEYNKTFFQLQSVNKQLGDLGGSNGVIVPANGMGGSNLEIVRIRTKLKELAPNKDDPKVSDQIKKLQEDLRSQQALLYGGTGGGGTNPETQRALLLSQKSDLEEQLKASDQTVGYLNREISKYSLLSNSDGGSDVKINALKNEVDIATKEYSDIKSKYMQAEGYQQTPTINFKQTLIGQPAVEPEPSHFLLFLGIAGFSMAAFSSLIIILLELVDSSIKTPSRFEDTVGLRLMDVVNRIKLTDGSLPPVFSAIEQRSDSAPDEAMFMRFMRKLRYDVESSGKKTILVTSTKKGEGKTTIIEALACALSMVNKKVLILDTQFSNNSLTRNFNINGGLEEFSNGSLASDLKSFRYIVTPTSLRGVDIVGCKGGNYTPDEILRKGNLLEQLDVLGLQYDYILLEGASLNDNSDAKELSRYAQGIVAVFAADSVINQSDRESIQFLIHENQRFIGCILNKVESDNIDI